MFYDFVTKLLTGGCAGIVSRTATAPLELYKIQRQNPFIPNSTLKSVIRNEGIRYLWKGNGANCIRVFPQFSINYAIFDYTKSHIPLNNYSNFVAGSLGGMISMGFIYPLETIRSRLSLQTKKNHYKGTMEAFKKISIRQLYQGCSVSLLGSSVYNAFNYSFYFLYKDLFKETTEYNKLLCGGLAGSTAVTITYPTDLIRRRLQLQGFDASVPNYKNGVDCMQQIVKKEGMRGLYRGLSATYIRLFPTNAIQFWVIEYCTKFFKK